MLFWETLPHYPYARAVDEALTELGIPPGRFLVYAAARPGAHVTRPGQLVLRTVLEWDRSRCARPAGVRIHWRDESGWTYDLVGARRPASRGRLPLGYDFTFAPPEAVAAAAAAVVRAAPPTRRSNPREWPEAAESRAAIAAFRRTGAASP